MVATSWRLTAAAASRRRRGRRGGARSLRETRRGGAWSRREGACALCQQHGLCCNIPCELYLLPQWRKSARRAFASQARIDSQHQERSQACTEELGAARPPAGRRTKELTCISARACSFNSVSRASLCCIAFRLSMLIASRPELCSSSS